MVYKKKHDGWKYFNGINRERLAAGKIDELIIYQKIKHLFDCNLTPTVKWNHPVDFINEDKGVFVEIKRRSGSYRKERSFKGLKGTFSTLLTFKKFEYLRTRDGGWLFIQYDDALFRCKPSFIQEADFLICYPFNIKHVSINLDCFEKVE